MFSTDHDVVLVNAAGGSESDDAYGGNCDYLRLDEDTISDQAIEELVTIMLRDGLTAQRDIEAQGPVVC